MPPTSGSASLEQLRREIARIGDGTLVRNVTRTVANASIAEVRKGFAASRDPYGRPWAPSRGLGGQTLQDTRRLHNSFTATITGPGQFRVGTNVAFAATHQYGATIKPIHSRFLVFEAPFASRIASGRGGYKRKKFGRAGSIKNLVFAKQVVVPRRQMMPEVELGPIWTRAFVVELQAALDALRGRT